MNYVEFNPKAFAKRIDVCRCPQRGLEDVFFLASKQRRHTSKSSGYNKLLPSFLAQRLGHRSIENGTINTERI